MVFLEPMFSWLSTDLACYPDTLNLKTMVHPRPGGIRPFIELEPFDHPLAVEFREGITIERVQEIADSFVLITITKKKGIESKSMFFFAR